MAQAELVIFFKQIYIFGGYDINNNPILEMEVFNSSSKTINKVMDDQGNWVKISNTEFVFGPPVCVVAIEEMNIFVTNGAIAFNDHAR